MQTEILMVEYCGILEAFAALLENRELFQA